MEEKAILNMIKNLKKESELFFFAKLQKNFIKEKALKRKRMPSNEKG